MNFKVRDVNTIHAPGCGHTIRKERLTAQGWVHTGQYWEDDEPIATTIIPGRHRLTVVEDA